MNNTLNYLLIEKEFSKNKTDDELKFEFWEGLKRFIKDLKKYGDNVIEFLKNKLKVDSLFYCKHFHFNKIDFPKLNYIFLYKKKQCEDFIAIKHNLNGINFFDLGNKNEITINNYNDFIDINYEYSYILNYSEPKSPNKAKIDNLEFSKKNPNFVFENINLFNNFENK